MDFNTPARRGKISCSSISTVFVCIGVLGLSACDSSSGGGGAADDSGDISVDTAGRLAFYDVGASAVSVLDLDSGLVENSFPVSGGAPRIYSSASKRHAVVVQRDDGIVSFLDSGIYEEDHGDHLHEYKDDPVMEDAFFSGDRPTHITEHDDTTAVFYDGQSGVVSSFHLFDDAAISAGSPRVVYNLENNMHGVVRQSEDKLFVTYRDPSITDTTLPASVERLHLDGEQAVWEHRYSESCPLLHGSAHNGEYLLFGCSDGMLSIALEQDDFPAAKLANPEDIEEGSRVGAIYAQDGVESFVAVAGDQLFVVDPSSSALPFALQLPEGASRIDQGFTRNGEWFYVLTRSGELNLFDVAQGFTTSVQASPFGSAYPETITGRLVTQSGSGEQLYLLDPTGTAIVQIAVDDQTVENRFNLGMTAIYPTWLGLSEHHEHEHEDDHDHED